ncbi:MAG: PQQ-dependent sugar dehydrogenase [Nitrospira sp.]|nr:PQQ-dependent sugar dehydrogenase [Nitrospira sp.]
MNFLLPPQRFLVGVGVALGACMALGTLSGPSEAWAHAGYVQQFNNRYPASQTGNASCAVCHSDSNGGSPWNAYGRDLLANGGGVGENGNLTPALQAVEQLNSDAVAGNNLTEIQAGAQPGWCNPATAGCNNQFYNANGSIAGAGNPPASLTLLDDGSTTTPEPNIQVTQASVNFGKVLIGQTAFSTVTINNTGQLDLTLNVALSGPLFAIVTPPAATVPGGGSTSVTLSYTPTASGVDADTLILTSNDPDTPTLNLALAGEGVTELPPDDIAQCPTGNELVDPLPDPITKGPIQVGLKAVADGFVNPLFGLAAPGDRGRLFVVDQTGQVWAVNLATGTRSLFLDVSSRLVPLGLFGIDYDERGLLGAAFAPDYFRSGRFYTYESVPTDRPADFSTIPTGVPPDHQSVVVEWRVRNPRDPNAVVDPASARELLRVDQPQFNHNGGQLVFGPDKMLYITFGDGGGADDQGSAGDNLGHSLQGNGQDPSNLLGTIIRINPRGHNAANGQYGIPEGNPFVNAEALEDGSVGGQAGCADGFCDEIFAYGFRNPWRASFDSDRDEVFMVADVGQNEIEEINMVRAGGNYGWRIKEGTFCFDHNGANRGFVTDATFSGPPVVVSPIAQYDHDEGISITGGFVYRGEAIKPLRGRYVFGDWAPTFVDPQPGRLFYLATKELEGSGDTSQSGILEFQLPGQLNGVGIKINGFGEDANGELYVIGSPTGRLVGTEGMVLKIVPASSSDEHEEETEE